MIPFMIGKGGAVQRASQGCALEEFSGTPFAGCQKLDSRSRSVCASISSLLRQHSKSKALSNGRRLHARIIECGFTAHTLIANCLIEMYGNCGIQTDARAVFDKLPKPNLYSWSILIKTYCQNGNLDEARNAFLQVPQRDAVCWTTMIAAFAQNGLGNEALEFFHQMHSEGIKPNNITFLCALAACATVADGEEGRKIHAAIINCSHECDVVLGTALVNMYGKCGNLDEARSVFSKMPSRDVVTWTAMITASAYNGYAKEALEFFRQMQSEGFHPNGITFVMAVDACARLATFKEGLLIHTSILHSENAQVVVVGNALINMYGKCRSVDDAKKVFGRMLERNVVSWNSIIAACAQGGHCKEALDFFYRMQCDGIQPDNTTFVTALDACASMASLEKGLEVHDALQRGGCRQDLVVQNSLVNLYGKCGSLDNAMSVFCGMPYQNVISWTTLIATFSQHGHGEKALALLYQMQVEGIKPNDTTFVCILNACSRTGLVDDAKHIFFSMTRDHGILHTIGHYVSMIDILGRTGQLDEAEFLIDNIPTKSVDVWYSLLGACQFHGDVERGIRAAKGCFELDTESCAAYVMLSNIYAAAG